MYRQLHTNMGLFSSLFSPRTKADIDREIAMLQGEVDRLKAGYVDAKERQKRISGINTNPQQYLNQIAKAKARIATLKAQRKSAPK